MRRSLLLVLLALAPIGCPQPADKPSEEKPPADKPPAPPEKKPHGDLEKNEGYRGGTAYHSAIEQAIGSEAVTSILGTPIKVGDVFGKKTQHKGYYDLFLEIEVSGPKGSGTLHVHEYNNEDIAIHQLSVRFVGVNGKEVSLPGFDRSEKDKDSDKKRR